MNEEYPMLTTAGIRKAVENFGQDGEQFGYALVYEVLGMAHASDKQKARVRKRINEMVSTGELVRAKEGVFVINANYRPRSESPFRARVWRYVRKQKPGWTLSEASLVTGVSYTHVMRYCDWLEQAGYIAAVGKNGTARTFRATSLADKTPEMPQPPTKESNPFEKECRAAGKIANLMLYGNPYQPKTAKEIVSACKVLLARFGAITATENRGENV